MHLNHFHSEQKPHIECQIKLCYSKLTLICLLLPFCDIISIRSTTV